MISSQVGTDALRPLAFFLGWRAAGAGGGEGTGTGSGPRASSGRRLARLLRRRRVLLGARPRGGDGRGLIRYGSSGLVRLGRLDGLLGCGFPRALVGLGPRELVDLGRLNGLFRLGLLRWLFRLGSLCGLFRLGLL